MVPSGVKRARCRNEKTFKNRLVEKKASVEIKEGR